MISCIEKECGIVWEKEYLPADIADIPESWVDIAHTTELLWWTPKINIEDWVKALIDWYRRYYNI